MNSSGTRHAKQKKHAGRPNTATTQAPLAFTIAIIRNAAIGVGCAVGSALLFLLAVSFLIRNIADPVTPAFPIAMGTLYVTSLLCGILAVRLGSSHQPWLCGIISGGILLLLCLLMRCLLTCTGVSQPINSFFSQFAVLPFSVLGAILGQKRPQIRSHRRRR